MLDGSFDQRVTLLIEPNFVIHWSRFKWERVRVDMTAEIHKVASTSYRYSMT
jgi:hypothetical protein